MKKMTKKKKTKDLREQQALENRWVFDLAHRLMEESDFDRSKALKQAHLVCELLGHLGMGVVTFEYMKQDGTLRTARGTLCQRLMPQQETDAKKQGKPRDYDRMDFAYWDWDKKAFRAFRAENVVRICAVSIPNYREPKHDDNRVKSDEL